MSELEKEKAWKRTFDVLKVLLLSGGVGTGIKGTMLLIQLTAAFTTLQNNVSQLQLETQELWKKSDHDIVEHQDMVRDINTLRVEFANIPKK
jgi:hypothetical protein